MQLYKDQLRNKHVSFHKEIQPAVKRMLLTSDTENNWKKKNTIRKQLLFTSSWKNAIFLKATLPNKEFYYFKRGGMVKSHSQLQNKKLEKFQKTKKKLEKTKKTIEPKRTKKNKENINSRLFRKLVCFTKTPWELFFWFYCSFWFYWSFLFSRGFLFVWNFSSFFVVFSFLEVFGVVFQFCWLFKAFL